MFIVLGDWQVLGHTPLFCWSCGLILISLIAAIWMKSLGTKGFIRIMWQTVSICGDPSFLRYKWSQTVTVHCRATRSPRCRRPELSWTPQPLLLLSHYLFINISVQTFTGTLFAIKVKNFNLIINSEILRYAVFILINLCSRWDIWAALLPAHFGLFKSESCHFCQTVTILLPSSGLSSCLVELEIFKCSCEKPKLLFPAPRS